ncbi:replication protein A 70 kDa DNA-binding subunit A-like [Brassica napus]|uniref:replication protein A 70 kDa DNA-binding subunit A-like n=1 Tax=Brassica napus TaxID=3708 RepID=UPI0020786F4C|nr:replication protein A 70 kDa DNA-binding subunit A-like [Brassica napus]
MASNPQTLKLLHSWKQSTSFSGDTLECVLVDQTGAKIQASCKRSQMNRVQRYLPVGEWKVVDTVKITGAGGQYRPTKQQYKMTILGDTSITPSDYRNDNQFLDLANYQEIVNGKLKPNFLIDIMGQVTDLGAVATVQAKGNDTKRVHFRLRDLSGQEVACCLWGKYAEQIETHMEETNDETLICLIRFAKISEFRGEVQITNAFDASLVCLNPTMEEAIDFRQKFKLHLIVKDDTETCRLLLLDTVGRTIIGSKAVELWDD